MALRPLLKDGLELEGPRLVDQLPLSGIANSRARLLEIRAMIGAKIEPAIRTGPQGGGAKKRGLQHPVLVMSRFGPGIWKKDKQIGDLRARRQSVQEEPGLSPNEVEMWEPGALPLASGTLDSFANKVDADADLRRVRGRIGGKKMPVAASDLPQEMGVAGEDSAQFRAELLPAIRDDRQIVGIPRIVIHGFPFADGRPESARPSPLPALSQTSRMPMSAGFTPLIRLAWPNVMGRMAVSFEALSLRRPLMAM